MISIMMTDNGPVTFIDCIECDKEVECVVYTDSEGMTWSPPDHCPHCGQVPVVTDIQDPPPYNAGYEAHPVQ